MSALLEAPPEVAKSNGHKPKKHKHKDDPPHPALTSAARQGLHPAMAASIAEEQLVELRLIHPHPDNRQLSDDDPDVIELAASLDADGLLQAITVRVPPDHWDLPAGHVQLVDGERRWRAARVAKLKTIRCKIREDLDDAQTKALLAVANAQRRDLNPIEKARLIEQLCTANADGSPPLTREAAAQKVGLETGAAASNLVRLLELPKPWQDRVAKGELPWTWAREILPVVKLEPVLDALEEDWKDRETSDPWFENAFLSRKGLSDAIDNFVRTKCRPVNEEHWTGNRHEKLKIDAARPEVREQFGIVEVELATGKRGQTETVLVATEAKVFDKALQKQAQRKGQASAAKAGEDEPEPKRELTAAERKAKNQERAKTRTDRILAWRDKLLRRAIVAALGEKRDSGLRLLLAYEPTYQHHHQVALHELLAKVSGKKPQSNDFRRYNWAAVATLTSGIDEQDLFRRMAVELLSLEPDDWRQPIVPHALVEAFATAISIDVATAWRTLQEPFDYGPPFDRQGLLEEFYLLHQTAELQDLARELGVHLLPSLATRAKIVQHLLSVPQGTTRRLPLPKSIKPLPIVGGKGKTTKTTKSTKRGR